MPDPLDTDASASEPVTDVDQKNDPTPQGRVGDPEGLTTPDASSTDASLTDADESSDGG